jgi:acetyl-CoA decarbonylase/synthase, CODH/ACS complex subunit gamma
MPTAIEFFKMLPKTNCGECGYPTCLAFAMQLANQKAKLEDCPYVSQEARIKLEAAAAPPIALVKIGTGNHTVEVGDETEIYRHEKKFFHPTAYALTVSDKLGEEEQRARVKKNEGLRFERVGQMMTMDMIAVRNDSGVPSTFADSAELVASNTEMPIILMTSDPEAMEAAVSRIAAKRPLLHAANRDNLDRMAAIAQKSGNPLVVYGDDGLDNLADLVEKTKEAGVKEIVLDFGCRTLKETLEKNTIVRRVSVKKTFRGMGFPTLVNTIGVDMAIPMGLIATMKYGSIVVFEDLQPQQALPLFVLRQNIYTDPQVPIQVKPDLYPVNNPDENAPILFTTNFSLTYFTVLGDVEKSKIPTWLQVVDTEGLSVMTAFAAGKLTPESVTKALEESGATEKSKRGQIIIPGMVSRMSGKLEELTNLKVVVGPRESSGIPKLLKSLG